MRCPTSPTSSIAKPSSNVTTTSKPVRGSCLPFAEAAVAACEEVPEPVEPEVGTLVPELVEGAPELLLPPPPPEPPLELPELPELPPPPVSVVCPLVLPPPFARGSWYWSSPALCAKLVAGRASMARAAMTAAVRLRSIRYL